MTITCLEKKGQGPMEWPFGYQSIVEVLVPREAFVTTLRNPWALTTFSKVVRLAFQDLLFILPIHLSPVALGGTDPLDGLDESDITRSAQEEPALPYPFLVFQKVALMSAGSELIRQCHPLATATFLDSDRREMTWKSKKLYHKAEALQYTSTKRLDLQRES